MTSNGNITTNGNGALAGNGRGVWKNIALESGGFAIAEGVSMVTSLGVVYLADIVAPSFFKGIAKTLSKAYVEPHLDFLEGGLKSICKLKECQPDYNKLPEERAEALAHTLSVFAAAWGLSMGFKVLTRRVWNDKWGLKDPSVESGKKKKWYSTTPEEFRILCADEGLHYGSLILMNTGLAKYTDDLIDVTSKMLQRCGMAKKKADEVSAMAMIWEVPNVLGMLAGGGAITYNHLSHRDKLARQTAAREAATPHLHHAI